MDENLLTIQSLSKFPKTLQNAFSLAKSAFFRFGEENVLNKKLKPYEKTEVAYKEILEGKKKAYDQKNAELRKQRLEKAKKITKN